MTYKNKTIIASIAILASITTVMVTSAITLKHPKNTLYIPDPVSKKELVEAKAFTKQGKWEKAAEILARNAVGNNVQAKYEYAMLYAKGWGVPRDLEKARNLLLQAVQRPFEGRARAAFELGRVYRISQGEDCARIAFEWFTKSLQWGYLKAHSELGKSHARGIGVKQDIDLALKHYRIAALHNSASAVVPLINLLARGSSTVDADPEKALSILNEFLPKLEVAAKNGDARAARSIARLYSNNLIMEPDTQQALKWFSMASRAGDAIAMHDLAVLLMEEKKQFAVKEDVLALLNESIRRNYAAAITTLGRLHLKSQFGLPERKAVELFEQGILAGHPGSMEELARLYLDGKHVEYNLEKARELAELGNLQKHAGSRKLLEEIKKVEKAKETKEQSTKYAGKG